MCRLLVVLFVPLSLASVPPNLAAFSPEYRECPENEQYTTCSSSSCFEAVCHLAPTLFCTRDCKTGCQCKRGFARRGDVCVPLAQCTGTSAIMWKSGDTFGRMGVLRLESEPTRCVRTANLWAGEVLTMHDCDKTSDLQLDFRVDGVIRSSAKPELCVAVSPSQGGRDGRTLVLAECADTDSQKFQVDRISGTIHLASQTSLCLGNRVPSSELSLFTCTGNSRQLWELADNGCIPAPTAPLVDYGVEDEYRGWYDTQGCGVCRDYCRWVGRDSGGDPALNQLVGTSHWSCGLAGSSREFTLPLHFTTWNFTKCSEIISDLELLRSAEARDLALLLEAEESGPPTPLGPRSVPRRPRITPSPTQSAVDSTMSVNSSASENATDYDAARIRADTQAVAVTSPPSNAYVIPVAVVGALVGVCLIATVLFCLCKRKPGKEAPPISSVPVETDPLTPSAPTSPLPVAVPAPAVPVAPRVVVLPVADDPPPPYHLAMADDDLDKTR